MADRGPQKVGAYERPARMKGMIIGVVVLIALIVTVRGTARHTDVEVQREPEDATTARRATASQGFAAYDATFREHYTTAFANSGAAYVVYEPATAMATS
jgi:hypothetical protein